MIHHLYYDVNQPSVFLMVLSHYKMQYTAKKKKKSAYIWKDLLQYLKVKNTMTFNLKN